jgi:type II secretory pathway pseudopilin PulG
MNSSRNRMLGISLLELLISIGLLGLVLALVSQYLIGGLQVTNQVANQTTMQQELRNAGSLIADEVQRALYVFPPCGEYASTKSPTTGVRSTTVTYKPGCTFTSTVPAMRVTFSKIKATATGITFRNHATNANTNYGNDYTWEVGAPPSNTDSSNTLYPLRGKTLPILMMIVGPKDPNVQCRMTSDATLAAVTPLAPSGNVNENGCYQFIAYYPIKRKCLTPAADTSTCGAGGLSASEQLETNTDNENQWVLMEYRRNLSKDLYGNGTEVDYDFDTSPWALTTLVGTMPVPRINWGSAGCGLSGTDKSFSNVCPRSGTAAGSTTLTTPNPDPNPVNQASANSIPAILRLGNDPTALELFRLRMTATMTWIQNNGDPGSGKILLDNILPDDGFQIEFPTTAVDERGATEIRLRLQAQVKRGSKTFNIPSKPIEFYASPRNISPQ